MMGPLAPLWASWEPWQRTSCLRVPSVDFSEPDGEEPLLRGGGRGLRDLGLEEVGG